MILLWDEKSNCSLYENTVLLDPEIAVVLHPYLCK